MMLLYMLSVVVICTAQEATQFVKLDNGNGAKALKQLENGEDLMRQIGEMGLLLENYRRVILSGITEAPDVCGFIENLRESIEASDKIPENNLIRKEHLSEDETGIKLYKNILQSIDDPVLKSQFFLMLQTQIDECFDLDFPNQVLAKRDRSQMQKIRFHSWGGKRARGAPKIVIRTPFHSWGGKRSGKEA
ncbi:CLUMA_CG009385, isoform A [Clunio marinus]|uniref:CLUMA_CG009385, isoform A n=1 Tax=Clunio marinus TaxID=568069 RepID=A0A1J1I6M5_9DIPT|nr:CLUMA_CG009385, isoform A [Clunio marinus]